MTAQALAAVRLRGRLGNHLFQYAAALGRTKLGEPVVVDDSLRSAAPLDAVLRPGSIRVISSLEAVRLGLPPRLPRGRPAITRRLDELMEGGGGRGPRHRRYRERREGEFDPHVRSTPAPVLLLGHFQNEGYLADQAERVAGSVRPLSADEVGRLHELDRALGTGASVAVVIRAGLDYEEMGWTQAFAWYRSAAEHVATRVGRPGFAVFSDVPLVAEAAAAAFSDIGPALAVTRVDPPCQLRLIAAMDHAVVAASSFAWWGAWLGDQRVGFDARRVVVAPQRWARDDLANTPSPRWTRLPRSELGS